MQGGLSGDYRDGEALDGDSNRQSKWKETATQADWWTWMIAFCEHVGACLQALYSTSRLYTITSSEQYAHHQCTLSHSHSLIGLPARRGYRELVIPRTCVAVLTHKRRTQVKGFLIVLDRRDTLSERSLRIAHPHRTYIPSLERAAAFERMERRSETEEGLVWENNRSKLVSRRKR